MSSDYSSSAVNVAIRIKPSGDAFKSASNGVSIGQNFIRMSNETKKIVEFTYDNIFDQSTTQEDIFNVIGKNVIKNTQEGYNSCVFTYGQTGCFAAGTKIMAATSEKYKKNAIFYDWLDVENIKVGSLLVGPDLLPRIVKHLYSGISSMWLIRARNTALACDYVVNSDHIMHLEEGGIISNVRLVDYIKNGSRRAKSVVAAYYDAALLGDHVEFKKELDNYELRSEGTYDCVDSRKSYRMCTYVIPNEDLDIVKDWALSLGHWLIYLDGLTTIYFDMYHNYEFDIFYMGEAKYYGFELDGDHLFIGENMSVWHNSGKTHTMMGGSTEESAGLIPRIATELIGISNRVEMSYFEIYSEKIQDLMNRANKGLTIREHPQFGPYIEGLTSVAINNDVMFRKLIEQGNKERTVATTLMNDRSSRSHAILTINCTGENTACKINLVDLAGSEKIVSSGVSGINLEEAININRSLSALSLVISKLSDAAGSAPNSARGTLKSHFLNNKEVIDVAPPLIRATSFKHSSMVTSQQDLTFGRSSSKSLASSQSSRSIVTAAASKAAKPHIPFRDSVLTWILKESLGGNSKTYMIATVSLERQYLSETLNTLRYAWSAKKIVNRVSINHDNSEDIINALKAEVSALQRKINGATDSKELDRLRMQLAEREELVRIRDKTWEQKLEESKRISESLQEQLRAELNEKQSEFINQLNSMRRKNSVLLGELTQLKKQATSSPRIDSAEKRMEEEFQKAKQDFERSRIVEASWELHKKFEDKNNELRKEYDAQLEEIKKNHILQLEEMKTSYENKAKELENSYFLKTAEHATEYEAKIEDIKNEYMNKLEEAHKDCDNIIRDTKNEYEAKIKETTAANPQLLEEIRQLRIELESQKNVVMLLTRQINQLRKNT
jgi:hypothetical protein